MATKISIDDDMSRPIPKCQMAKAMSAATMVAGTSTLDNRLAISSFGVCELRAFLIAVTMRARIVVLVDLDATISRRPWPFLVPAITLLPIVFSTERLSPVISASLTADAPAATTPSVGIVSSGSTIM